MDNLNVDEEKSFEQETEIIPEAGVEAFNSPFEQEDGAEKEPRKRFVSYDKREKSIYIGKFRIKLKLLIIIFIVLFIIIGLKACSAYKSRHSAEDDIQQSAPVERRTVQKKVTGSSVIEPKDSYSIMTITTGEVTNDYIKEGDVVKKGDKLYQFDAETPQNNLNSAKNALDKAQKAYNEALKTKTQTVETNNQSLQSAKLGVEKAQKAYDEAVKTRSQTAETNGQTVQSAQLAVERAQQSYNDALDALDDLNITSDIGGTVGEVFVTEGGMVQAGAPVADVYSDRYLKIVLPFIDDDAAAVSVGDAAVLTVSGSAGELWGSVTKVGDAPVTTSSHSIVRYVTIETENPGGLTTEDSATAMVGDIACSDAAQFEYIDEYTISASASGEIKSLYIDAGDTVYENQTVAQLDEDSARSALNSAQLALEDANISLQKAITGSDSHSQDASVENARLALEDAKIAYEKAKTGSDTHSLDNSIDNAKLSLDDAKLSLEKAQKALDDYTITAPISGTVVTKNIKAGDKIDSSTSQTPMCVIYDMSSMQFDIDVDEIDVESIKVGQEVTITADAVEDKTYKGIVEKVSVNGVSENGVTNYPVTVRITDFGELLPGMNVDAEIVVDEAENALTIPVSSLNRGNTVYVAGEKTDENDKAPEGYKTVSVTTGISDDDYIEIKSGLKEGDMVHTAELDYSSDLEQAIEQNMGGGEGGPEGGPNGGRGGPREGSGGGPGGGM